ncbi:MAG: polyhydroxyalkanoic acid system family protein [Xanthobacteraceae bacterium]|nr:polyhydroxyalkanoic acid system family protein [Xanthobacteraceae bacterium]
MSEKVTVSIPHKLGKEEAARRIKRGFAVAREKGGGMMNFADETWSGDQVAFNVSMLGQNAAGNIDIHDDHVVIDVTLPWLLAKMAEQAKVLIEKQGNRLLLEKK